MTPEQVEDIRQRYNMVRGKNGWVVQLTDEEIDEVAESYMTTGCRARNTSANSERLYRKRK